ncbi:MAG: hypothetical protein HKN67_11985 [Saprospiraceae bacterium]|nr:hypothetical protein [Saprospiraceae bacterium]
MNHTLFIIVFTLLIACRQEQTTEINKLIPVQDSVISIEQKKEVPSIKDFKLDTPTRVLVLPNELVEISGLSYDHDQNHLIAVNDEKGFIYYLDKQNGRIISKKKFAGKGDYEGVELCNDLVYIVRSDGDIIRYFPQTELSEKKRETILSQVNDVEGLGYDMHGEFLVFACKGSPAPGKSTGNKSEKAFFAYDIKADTLMKSPLFKIPDDSLISFYERHFDNRDLSKAKVKKFKSRLKSFSPSGIAVHPESGKYFILSSVGKLLVVVTNEGILEWIEFLNPDIHYQPEGLCFDKEGHLYISNEGKNLKAKIFYYELK